MSSNVRNLYNMKKIKKINNIDQMYNQEEFKNLIIKPQKIEKPNLNIESMVNTRDDMNKKDLEESRKKRVNQPYKGIIKDCDFSKIREKHEEDLVVHKVNEEDKDLEIFKEKMSTFKGIITEQNKVIEDAYSLDKKNEHKKEFDYQHVYKYRTKIDDAGDNDVRIDRIEYYKKEQSKLEENKKKIDDIFLGLIETGILSENLDSIDYSKVDANELETTLRNAFGDEEVEKLLKEFE